MVGGIATLTDVFLQQLASRTDLEVHLWAPPGSQPPDGITLHPSYHRHRFPEPRPLTELLNGFILRRLIRGGQFDGALFMDASGRAYAFPFVPRLPSVLYIHGGEVGRTSWWRELTTLKRTLIVAAMRRVDRVLCNSNGTGERAAEIAPEVKVQTVYPCYDPRRVYSHGRHSDNPHELGFFTFLTVARLVPRKGHDTVLRMLARLNDRLPPWRYCIVGDGPILPELRALVGRLGLGSKVVFAGVVSNEDLGAFYHHADLLVMLPRPRPGQFEGFGLTYIEAALSGTPSLGSKHGGVKEAVRDGKTGVLVAADDSEEVDQAVLELVHNPHQLEQLARNAGERAQTEFSPQNFAEGVLGALSRA
jgi:phosphatidyl-myo-inositol dimannoside synthase